jgi:hypothetical protein
MHEKRWKLTIYEVIYATSAEEMAATWILGDKHVNDPSEALVNESPPGTQNC